MQCEEWADENSELFKEAHDEAVHKNSYKRKLYELISASLNGNSLRTAQSCLTVLSSHSPKIVSRETGSAQKRRACFLCNKKLLIRPMLMRGRAQAF